MRTRGAATMNLPAEAVQEVVVSRVTPPLFQSLNAAGAVQVTTRSGGEDWHGNLFGNLRDHFSGWPGFRRGPRITAASSMGLAAAARYQGQGFFVYRRGTH